jgi:hypothetical protein
VGTGANGVEEGHQQHQQRGAPASEGKAGANPRELTDEERTEVRKLQKQDQEVRTHEQAHVAAGGQHVSGGPSYEYETGPDGKRYASGGEVQIDTSPVKGDPQATIAKMQTVRKAALAPAQPSPQDRSVAAKASQQERKARTQLREEQQHQGSSATNKSRPRSEKPTYGPQGSIQPAAPGTVQAPGGALNLIA